MLPTPILIGVGLILAWLVLAPSAPWAPPQQQQTPQPPTPVPPSSGDSVPPFVPGFGADDTSLTTLQGPNPGLINPQPTPPPVGGSVPLPIAPAIRPFRGHIR